MPGLYSYREYADMHAYYGMAHFNAREATRLYAAAFPNRVHPDYRTFIRIHEKLCRFGSFKVDTERQGLDMNPERTEIILNHFDQHPETSVRRSSLELGIPRETIRKTLKFDHHHAYHFTPVMEMLPGDEERRIEFCTWFSQMYEDNHAFPGRVFWTDEATFTRTGIFNGHNTHLWAHENPHAMMDNSFQRQFKVNIWCGMIDNIIIGPHILPDRLNADNFTLFLENDLPHLLEDVPLNIRQNAWFQLDGCPAHYDLRPRNWLSNNYPDRWIGRAGPVSWPPRSPDLTPLDFFLWGVLKNEVYRNAPQSLDELIQRITESKNSIRPDQAARATASVVKRSRQCIAVGGGRFESL